MYGINIGKQSFRFTIIEFCEKEKLFRKENNISMDLTQCYLSSVGYNLRSLADSNRGRKSMLKETKKKLSISNKGRKASLDARAKNVCLVKLAVKCLMKLKLI